MRPPADLARGGPGRALWRDVTKRYDPTELEAPILAEACRTVDRLEELRTVIEADGVTILGSKGQRRLHPALAEERLARLVLARLTGMLRIPDEAPVSARSAAASRAANTRWRVFEGTG